MESTSRIYVAGHSGLVGSSLVRRLEREGYRNLLLRSQQEIDLLDQAATRRFFETERPQYVFLAAARVGGIHANRSFPADFLYENLVIAANVIQAAATYGVEKLLFLGSSCIYPKFAPQPIREESLLTSTLEPTNEGYALAKIVGLKLCEAFQRQHGKRFISAMPTNLYGPGDNFHPEHSHVVPGLLRRIHQAKVQSAPSVTIWGTGTARRELLYVDDLAEALMLLMRKYERPEPINVGTGEDLTILELAQLIRHVVGYTGDIVLDPTKPDGTPRKLLDVTRIRALGWRPCTSLEEGLAATYRWALSNQKL